MDFLTQAGTVLLDKSWAIAKILILFFLLRAIAYRLINKTISTIAERNERRAAPEVAGRVLTMGALARSVTFYVLIFIAGIMLLRVFEINPVPVLTAAGVVGLAVGFGAQKLVRDVITGFFIVLENQYAIGDYVTIGAVTGTVVELGMRTTQIRDDVGKLVFISNGDVALVTNHSRGPIQAMLDISVPADADLDKVRAAINAVGTDVAAGVPGVIKPPVADGITAVDASKVTVRVVGEVRPGRQEAVQMALREGIRQRFVEEQIKLV